MMQALREGNKPIFYLIIFFFIVGFIFLDIGGGAVGCNDQQQVPNAMALVNGEAIPYSQYQTQRSRVLNQPNNGNPLSDRQVLELEAQTYHQLIEDVLIKQAAEKRGLGTNLNEVLQLLRTNPPQQITTSPVFQTDGQFDVSKYYQALGDQRFLNGLVSNYLTDLPRTKLNDEIGGSVRVSEGEVLDVHASRKQQATISFVRVRPSAYGPAPTSLEPVRVASWYAEHSDDYDLDNAAVVSYIRVQRSPSRVDSIETREILDSIHAEIEDGEPFDELLDAHSVSAVSMRGGPKGTWIGPNNPLFTHELGTAIEGLAIGDYTRPFSDVYGNHIVAVDSMRTTESGTTEYRIKDIQVRIEISATTEQQVEQRMLGIRQDLAKSGEFTAVADTAGLTVRTSEPIDLSADRVFIPGLPDYVEVRDLLINQEVGTFSDIIKGAGGWFVFRIDSRGAQPAPALTSIEPQVRADMVAELGSGRAKEITDTLRSLHTGGADLVALAAADSSLTLETTRPFVRYYRIPEIGREPAVTGAAFAAEIGATVGPIEGSDGAQYFIRVDERDPDPRALTGTEREELIGALRANLLDLKRNEVLSGFLQGVRDEAQITDYRRVRTGTPTRR